MKVLPVEVENVFLILQMSAPVIISVQEEVSVKIWDVSMKKMFVQLQKIIMLMHVQIQGLIMIVALLLIMLEQSQDDFVEY